MSASIGIPPAEMAKLRATLRKYSEVSKKTEAQIVNDKALDLAFKALQQTDKANKDQIAQEMGQIGVAVKFSKKSGRFRASKRILADDSFAARIINSRLFKKGKPLLFGKDLEKAAAKMTASRIKATSFIRSGWLGAANRLRATVGGRRQNAGDSQIRGDPKGDAKAARPALMPVAEIINFATKDSPKARAVAHRGLMKAIPIVIADMEKYIERKMQEATDKTLGK